MSMRVVNVLIIIIIIKRERETGERIIKSPTFSATQDQKAPLSSFYSTDQQEFFSYATGQSKTVNLFGSDSRYTLGMHSTLTHTTSRTHCDTNRRLSRTTDNSDNT